MLDIKIVNGTSVHNTPIEIGIKDQKIVEVAASIERIYTYAAWADKYDGHVHHTTGRNVVSGEN